MPELPEVEAARRLADKHCKGKRIIVVHAEDDDKVFDKTAKEVHAELVNRIVTTVRRKGKYFWFELSSDGPHALLLHFGMAGFLAIKGHGAAKYVRIKDCNKWPPTYTRLCLEFEDGTALAFADARRFSRIKLLSNPEACEPVSRLGRDAFEDLPSIEEFTALMARQRRALKAVLIDQTVVSGIGNWVADEVLYQARVFPELPCCDLVNGQVKAVHDAIRNVLNQAVEVDADAARLPREWLFHYRWTGKKKTTDFHGETIEFLKVGGRTTAYVPALQVKIAATNSDRHGSEARSMRCTEDAAACSGDEQSAQANVDRAVLATAEVVHSMRKGKQLAEKLSASRGHKRRNDARKEKKSKDDNSDWAEKCPGADKPLGRSGLGGHTPEVLATTTVGTTRGGATAEAIDSASTNPKKLRNKRSKLNRIPVEKRDAITNRVTRLQSKGS